jgi:membrane associated rhomboid family serine protease
MQFNFMAEFPLVTFAITILLIATFIFTTNLGERIFNPQAKNNLEYYEELFGFIPARPKIYSLITYTFIHANFWHLLGNLIILVITGIALEKHIGKIPFLSIYISSGCTAATFDIINRLLLGISMRAPFVGASGSIFGLVAITSLTKPTEKVPTILVLLTFLPLFQFLLGLPVFADERVLHTLILFLFPFVLMALVFLPLHLSFFHATILFILSWILSLIFLLPVSISHIGHLGGFFGGLLSMFLFPKKKS